MPLTPQQLTEFKARVKSKDLKPTSEEFKALTRTMYDQDTILFMRRFLKDHVTDQSTGLLTPSPPFHQELIDLYQTQMFVAIAAPRGHAKSTLTSFAYAMHCALYGTKKNIIIISSTEKIAIKFLNRIRAELEFNRRILAIFGIQRTEKWSETEIKLANGTVIHAAGRGAQIRGLIVGASRPDLIICDDIEDDELVRSELRRIDLEDWFNAAVLQTLEPKSGQLIFIGTILHMSSLLNRVLDKKLYPDFVSKRYKAMQDDGTFLWPEKFSGEILQKKKDALIARGQLAKFYMEYQNDPIPEENAVFKYDYFQFFDELPPRNEIITEVFVDLGGGGIKKSADDTAMIVLCLDRHNNLYVHDYVCDKMGTDTKRMIEELFLLHGKYHATRYVIEKGVASNLLKASLEAAMLTRGVHLNIEYVNPTRGSADRRGNMSDGKYQRIAAMEGAFKLGVIKMRKWMTKLQEQLQAFPRGQHDDLADALSYGYMFMERLSQENHEADNDGYEPLYPELGL